MRWGTVNSNWPPKSADLLVVMVLELVVDRAEGAERSTGRQGGEEE
jgi:hypothetical protein